MKFFSQEKPLIEFISTVPGLSSIEECKPKYSNKALPSWWTNLKTIKAKNTLEEETSGNVKNCPSFPDYFSQGFIIPMWTDTIIKYDSKTDKYQWKTSDSSFTWQIHSHEQFLKDVPFYFLKNKVHFIFKTICPWRLKTPKGYSVYQLPLIYHFNNEIGVFPGVIDTDVHHEINQQVMVLSDNSEIFIKRGTPFVQYIPFKREKKLLEVRDATDKDKTLFLNGDRFLNTKFSGSNQYNMMRKERIESNE